MADEVTHQQLIQLYQPPDLAIDRTILRGMDSVDWASLRGCYGPAGDVPVLLRACLSTHKAHRELAFGELWDIVEHQGTVYQASGYVVPFLIQILVSDRLPEKFYILSLLTALAYGQLIREDLPSVRQAVHRELNACLPYLHDPDPETRQAAVELLSQFPEEAGRILPLFYDYIQAETAAGAQSEDTLAGLIHYTIKGYLLTVTSEEDEDRVRFFRLFERLAARADLDRMVRFPSACAAVALAPREVSDLTLQIIFDAVAQPIGVDPYSRFVQPDPEFIPPEMHQAICMDHTIEKAAEALAGLPRPRAVRALIHALEIVPSVEHQHIICFTLLCAALLGKYYQRWYGHAARLERGIVYYTREDNRLIYPVLVDRLAFDRLGDDQKQAVWAVQALEQTPSAIPGNLLEAFGLDSGA